MVTMMRALLIVVMATGLVGCRGVPAATPAPVEIEWPDAAIAPSSPASPEPAEGAASDHDISAAAGGERSPTP